jgi:putative heme-binding domain-containing protein
MFSQAACFKCHRFAGQGGIVGPDLTGAGRRFNDLNLLEALVEPSKVVSDQYEATTFILESGKAVTGRIVNLAGDNYLVSENMLDPGKLTPVSVNEIEESLPSKVSMMPNGLLDTLTQEEILDLVAYLRAGGDPQHQVFKPQAD